MNEIIFFTSTFNTYEVLNRCTNLLGMTQKIKPTLNSRPDSRQGIEPCVPLNQRVAFQYTTTGKCSCTILMTHCVSHIYLWSKGEELESPSGFYMLWHWMAGLSVWLRKRISYLHWSLMRLELYMYIKDFFDKHLTIIQLDVLFDKHSSII